MKKNTIDFINKNIFHKTITMDENLKTITVEQAFQMLTEKYGREYSDRIKVKYTHFSDFCNLYADCQVHLKGKDVSCEIFGTAFYDHPDDKWMHDYKVIA